MDTHKALRRTRPGKVGFYACGALVRVMLRNPESSSYPRVTRVDCPRCGFSHTVHLSWRAFKETIDAGKEAMLLDATGD